MYSNVDFERYKAQRGSMMRMAALCALPGFVVAIAGFFLRIELMCSAGLIVALGVLIFLYDLKLKPVLRYGAYLKEIHSGMSRTTAGALVRVEPDPVYQDGVWLREVILNIYEDLSEEGERRFLLDSTKEIPEHMIGRDVALTSHGNFVLDIRLMEESSDAKAE